MPRIVCLIALTLVVWSNQWVSTNAQAPGQQRAEVGTALAVRLIRTTLVALGHANATGNYTVFRDLAAPGFRDANSAARLSEIFTDLRARAPDLGAVVLITPVLTKKPFIDSRKMLRVTGYFPTRPLQLQFDLAYQQIGGKWRLFGISVGTPKAPAATAAPSRKSQ